NQCDCTSSPGQRKFDVAIDGHTVLNDYDIAADVGTETGTGKSFAITSDGDVNIDLLHVVENPLINGIEILRADAPPPTPAGGVDWSTVRGMTLANGKLYYAKTDGTLYSMDFANGAPVRGTETLVSPASDGYDWASNGFFVFPHSNGGGGGGVSVFSDDFTGESNACERWTGATNMTLDPSTFGAAAPSAKALSNGTSAFAYKNLPSAMTTICMKARVNVASFSGTPTLFRLRTAT